MVSRIRKSPKRKSSRSSRPKGKPKPTRKHSRVRRKVRIIDPANPFDRALSRLKEGATQKSAAKAEGVTVKALRKFMRRNTRSKWVSGKWQIKDTRAVKMLVLENGKFQFIPVGSSSATKIGSYWNAVNQFLDTNNPKHLPSARNATVRDAYGKVHHLELDPNALRRSDSIGELSFHTLYAETIGADHG